VARLQYAASYTAQGPLGNVAPRLLARLDGWLHRDRSIRASLDAPTLRALLALAPLFPAYREYRRDTVPLYHRAATPPDEAAAALAARLRAALGRLEAAASEPSEQ
jgi:hypothetical protein